MFQHILTKVISTCCFTKRLSKPDLGWIPVLLFQSIFYCSKDLLVVLKRKTAKLSSQGKKKNFVGIAIAKFIQKTRLDSSLGLPGPPRQTRRQPAFFPQLFSSRICYSIQKETSYKLTGVTTQITICSLSSK